MKILKLLLALLIGFTVLNWHPSGAAAQDDVVAAAKKEGQLVLYLSTNLTDANGLVQLFNLVLSPSRFLLLGNRGE